MFSPELQAVRAEAQAELRANAPLLYPFILPFQHPQETEPRRVRCGVTALTDVDRRTAERVIAGYPDQTAQFYAALRVVDVHPDDHGDDRLPPEDSTAILPRGTLTVVRVSDEDPYTGTRVLTCVYQEA